MQGAVLIENTEASAPTTPRKATFLQRSASVASLIAWKARFDSYTGRFTTKPSFVSYANCGEISEDGNKMRCKFGRESIDEGYSTGSENDFPPEYDEVVTPPPLHPEKEEENHFFQQDFTALENYFKKTLSIKRKTGSKGVGNENATERVFQWLHGLPEGDNLEEFLDAYGIPTEGVNLEDMKAHLKAFIRERLANGQDINAGHVIDHLETDEGISVGNDAPMPRWERQIADLKELAEGDNFEHWLESLDVPFYRPIQDTKEEIRKYLGLHLDAHPSHPPEPPPKPNFTSDPPQMKDIETLTPQWKELVEKMRSLKNEDELDKWLDTLEVPCCIPHDTFKAAIRKFFMHEEFENFAGKSIIFKEDTFAKKLWEKFEDAGVLKQVTLVAGTTVVMGLVAVLSTTLLSFAIPAGATFAIMPLFTEVFAQYFLQRQEIAFNLFNVHAQNAKPLSTAWAKQYILYKYC